MICSVDIHHGIGFRSSGDFTVSMNINRILLSFDFCRVSNGVVVLPNLKSGILMSFYDDVGSLV